MKIKTSTLTGEKLAYWTARAQRWEYKKSTFPVIIRKPFDTWLLPIDSCRREIYVSEYRPDIDGKQAMELVTAFRIIFSWTVNGNCMATTETLSKFWIGETPEIAICRAVVAFAFGEEVDDEG